MRRTLHWPLRRHLTDSERRHIRRAAADINRCMRNS